MYVVENKLYLHTHITILRLLQISIRCQQCIKFSAIVMKGHSNIGNDAFIKLHAYLNLPFTN